jgi:hypothetical protein
VRSSDTLTKISPALVAVLAELRGAVKDSKNPHFKNDYASLESVVETVRPVLASHKLGVMQGPGELNHGALTVTTRIIHESGEWIESDLQVPLVKADPQAAGSAITYARRYGLMAMLSLPALDDDGEAAHGRGSHAAPHPTPMRKSAAQAKRDGDDKALREAIEACPTEQLLNQWYANFDRHTAQVPLSWLDPIRDMVESRRNDIIEQLKDAA